MRILLRVLFTLLCSWVCCQTALAGPNAGGTLILALSEGTAYSPDIDYCQSVTATSCEAAVYNTGSAYEGETVVLNCLAAFPVAGRLAGITFGVNYDPNSVAVIDFGACGDFELPDPSWPVPLSGTAVTWSFRRTEQLVPVYWFAAYSYNYAVPYSLTLRIHPTQGGNFADDSVPAVLDPIEGFGAFGFNDAGALPCPVVGEPTGACCFADGTCSVETEADCATAGGSYQGNDTTCEPNPCDQPTGACCFADGSCSIQTSA
ncbi:MAG: hypothetical protein KC729_05745, partial [Candidatus Eisenbacteria bacterium]|nr:hypothetical protein [Candidatus Eisenbacteria bacterium]